MRWRWVILAAVVVAGVLVWQTDRSVSLRSQECEAEVGETVVRVDLEQAKWSALMSAISMQRQMPARATTIAIATAYQESKIHNIDYGDRDSVGLFQQRPSQGWGSVEQILDPAFAINAFYDGLEKVPGYTELEITDAAQRVQRSAFPEAYADHEADGRALASSLRGASPAAFWCEITPQEGGSTGEVAEMFEAGFGTVRSVVEDGDLLLPVAGKNLDVTGWAYAHYAVANAYELAISEVAFDGMVWRAASSKDGWVESDDADRTAVRIALT